VEHKGFDQELPAAATSGFGGADMRLNTRRNLLNCDPPYWSLDGNFSVYDLVVTKTISQQLRVTNRLQ
jgi:hypothetical protein